MTVGETRRVWVVGAGGHAKVVIATLKAAGFRVGGVLDDDPARAGSTVLGVPVLGTTSKMEGMDDTSAVLAIGDNRSRADVSARLHRARWAGPVVHPDATVHDSVQLGQGTVVFAGAVVQPDTEIGNHVIVNTGATVDHDCVLGDHCHVGPGAHLAGGVSVGEGVLVGVGASVLPGISIGNWSVVGSGAAVVETVPPYSVVAGVPARVRLRNSPRREEEHR